MIQDQIRKHPYVGSVLLTVILSTSAIVLSSHDISQIDTPIENLSTILSSLATAQAGVLAIVFSVMLFGIEFSASQYYAFSGQYYSRTPIFRLTFLWFVFSISLSFVFLIRIQPDTAVWKISRITYTTTLTATAATSILFLFIHRMIRFASPIGLLELIQNQAPPKERRSGVDAKLYAIYSIILSAISKGDSATAEEGLDKYESRIQELAEIDKSEQGLRSDGGYDKSSIGKALQEHLPTIIIKSNSDNQIDIANNCFNTYINICENGAGIPTIENSSYSGLKKILERTPDDSYLLARTWRAIGKILVISSESYTSSIHLYEAGEDIYSIPLSTSAGRESAIELLSVLPSLVENILDDEREIWSVPAASEFADLVENVTKFAISESTDIELERKLAKSLADSVLVMSGGGVPSRTEPVLVSLIEAGMICTHRNKNRMYIWTSQIARVCEQDQYEDGLELYIDNLMEERSPRLIDIPEYTPFTDIESHEELATEFKNRIEEKMNSSY